ncbi:TonB-dependent receptor [Alteriqipengyuania lutimaris]|uniref:TonB-dependent receptor n=1 Tax=Alteriqipengyuania lutimaris TaxID=1538146 RepID=A0A395LNZ5_9SPHN|nr:TonB-dependent receptor [Alteriqipengyuania lutimaris]MBB3033860.1 outer membrane receptor protein involved in Fe transport [Alteriqipengyuania lutimaris]RDS78561.1 TonB-dependent receptor [Alteriqipengyuania lutimaris]
MSAAPAWAQTAGTSDLPPEETGAEPDGDGNAAPAVPTNTIIVTATRRAESVQDIPLNITAVGGEQIEEQGLTELSDLLPFVPGINIVDRGGRQGNPIIVRGLNLDGIGSGDGNNDGGGTVATYIGEIPLFVDLKLNDLERVEVLLGPQGTLYGAGTLGGAIRYIPVKPQFGEFTSEARTELSKYSEAESASYQLGATMNLGLSDTFAIRGSLDYEDDSGFIDYVNVVDTIGVTNPDTPAGLNRIEDADGEETLSGRIAARYQPSPQFEVTATYYYQKAEIEGRRVSHYRSDVPGLLDGTASVGRYENAFRVREPNTIENDLIALEATVDLGFAELTSSTGWSSFSDDGQRDQTTLLITLEYSYELFPSFTAFTREVGESDRFNQEVRLVSAHGGPLSWIIGGFYNRLDSVGSSSEFVPNYVPYVNAPPLEFGLTDRPDALEYFSTGRNRLEEFAVYGEASYELFDGFTVTLGGRYYSYDLAAVSTVDFPLFEPLSYTPLSLDEIARLPFDPALAQSDDGALFKANVAWEMSDDILLYGTISEGYRIGGVNGVGPCPPYDPDATQGACALAPGQEFDAGNGQVGVSDRDERQFSPDQTRNYEIGVKSTLADGTLIFNAAAYYIDWMDPQLGSATVNANIPITVNGEGAESKGVELSADWRPTDRINLRANFTYIDSKLTAPVPDLIRTISPPGFGSAFEDGADGDRLAGSPETQFSIFGAYALPLANGDNLRFNASYSWQGDVETRTAGRGNGLMLDSFGVANAAISYEADSFIATLFADNLFDTFAETGAIGTALSNQDVFDFNGDPVYVRGFSTHILPPRQIGVRLKFLFGE